MSTRYFCTGFCIRDNCDKEVELYKINIPVTAGFPNGGTKIDLASDECKICAFKQGCRIPIDEEAIFNGN